MFSGKRAKQDESDSDSDETLGAAAGALSSPGMNSLSNTPALLRALSRIRPFPWLDEDSDETSLEPSLFTGSPLPPIPAWALVPPPPPLQFMTSSIANAMAAPARSSTTGAMPMGHARADATNAATTMAASSSQVSQSATAGNRSTMGKRPRLPATSTTRKEPKSEVSKITTLKRIGSGTYGRVYQAVHSDFIGQAVALKSFKYAREFKIEHKILSQLNHPNVVKLLATEYDTGRRHYGLVMEYAPQGDLETYISNRANPFDWNVQGNAWALSAAYGLQHIHRMGIIHLDLKPANMLIFSNDTLKLADFGLSLRVTDVRSHKGNLHGSICYAAPEALISKNPELKSDVYSFGLSLWEMHARHAPYKVRFNDGRTYMEFPDEKVSPKMLEHYNRGMPVPISSRTPQPIARVMRLCWIFDPKTRIDSNDLVAELSSSQEGTSLQR